MKKFIKIIVLIVIAMPFIGSLVTSCSEEENCAIGRPMLWSTFYIPRETNLNEWVAYHLDSLTVTALRTVRDTVLNDEKDVQFISLPLEYTADTTTFVLEFTHELKDTIILRYTNTQYFVSMECGTEMRQTVDAVQHTNNWIDSISVRNKETNRNATDNLRFYFRPTN